MDCDIIVREFKRQSHYFIPFKTNNIGKGMSVFISHLRVKYYHDCSSIKMTLALNEPQKLICYQKKKKERMKDMQKI